MADEHKAPTEEQLAEVTAKQNAEMAKWEGDFKEEDLKIPYKREAEAEEEPKNNEEAEEKADEGQEAEPEEQPDEELADPESVVTVEDPGEYTPADYSFEVTLKDGKTHKISTPEEAEKLADDPDNFETPKQLMEFITKSNKMQRNLDRDYEKWEEKHNTFTTQLETETERREQVNNYVSEFNYLVGKGLIPAVPKEYIAANWSDPEVAKQPGVKEQIELLNYMVEENKTRSKAGIKQLTSIVDAFNAWQLDTKRQSEEQERKVAGEKRQAAGSRVASVSPSNQGMYVPKGIAVGNPNILKRGAAQWDD